MVQLLTRMKRNPKRIPFMLKRCLREYLISNFYIAFAVISSMHNCVLIELSLPQNLILHTPILQIKLGYCFVEIRTFHYVPSKRENEISFEIVTVIFDYTYLRINWCIRSFCPKLRNVFSVPVMKDVWREFSCWMPNV